MTPQRFRKRPVVIEAMRWDGTPGGAGPIIDWALSQGGTIRWHEERFTDTSIDVLTGGVHTHEREVSSPTHLAVDTLEGTMKANPGDWIIRGVAGEFYPCRNDVFLKTYELDGPS